MHKNQKSINSDANPINNFSTSEHGFILDNVVDDVVYRTQLKYINLNILTCFFSHIEGSFVILNSLLSLYIDLQ